MQENSPGPEPDQVCRARGCSEPAFKAPDGLSYAGHQYVWICVAGHEIPAERPWPGSRGSGGREHRPRRERAGDAERGAEAHG